MMMMMMMMMMMLVLLGYMQLATSLLNIFYTTAQFAQQIRQLKQEESQIKTFSMATVAQLVWRTLIVGSRILIFVLFALLFRYWLFVVVGVHYLLMVALVYYQLHLTDKHKQLIVRIVYNIVTPFVYIFDFCMNWLEGPTRYWYLMCYVPMYCENLLMSGLCLRSAITAPTSAWYMVPGCLCVVVMFPLGVLVQLAYYRYWHLKAPIGPVIKSTRSNDNETAQKTTRLPLTTWSEFRTVVINKNKNKKRAIKYSKN